ncbi:Colicin I receptor precursor [Leminorella richardii]|uniref:Colicin I receptor n=1 Tax=Leminorella richardii TaxID=158841 RepID=A0A2X4UYF3_9GAMM|nr:TonB-dependent copper receptor [Leminorella richardii]SQI43419.1 Colicin I receptor precursor [Leminorella richardii]
MKTVPFFTPTASLMAVALGSFPLMAEESHRHTAPDAVSQDDTVMVVTAPVVSPLEVVTSPKTPRQPVPASDGSDYLKTIPGFSQIRNGGTNGDPVFRGMFGSRLRLLTNNGEMLGACGGRMDAPSSYISPESFDRLTLIKGPETVLWGPGNSAGTIRFDREPPYFGQPEIKGDASALVASNDRWDSNADISFGNQDGYVRLIGNKSRANDYKDGNGDRVPSKWDKWNADIAIGWTPDTDTLLEFSAGKGDGEARYAGRSMDGSQFKRESLGVRFEKSNISDFFDKFEASAYYNYADHIMDNYSLRSPGGSTGMGMRMANRVDRRTLGGRMMGTWTVSDYELKSGVDMQLNTHRKESKMGGWNKDARFADYGVFSELTWNMTEQGKAIGGARLDRAIADNYTGRGSSERTDMLPAGFVRYEYSMADVPVMLYAGVGYTERFPDYWELFSPTYGTDGSSDVFDKVKTEKTTQLDVGAQYSGKRLNGWVSAYVGRIDDFILFRYSANNARISQVNNVNATVMGGETGVSYRLTDEWKTDASLAYSWAQNTDNNSPLPQIPPLEARLSLSWERGGWSSTGLLRLVSAQHRVAINEGNVAGKDFDSSAGFAIFSANAAYRMNEYVKVSVGVDNLFDKAYSEHLNLAGNGGFGYSANTPVNEPGRTFWLKTNVAF